MRIADSAVFLFAATLTLAPVASCGDDGGCPSGQQACEGLCATLSSDRDNCGACGNVCADGEICVASECVLSCPEGQEPCSGLCIDPLRDRNHCGGCNLACNPGEVCDGAGHCALSCQAGLLDCDGTCVDPNTDVAFCGATGDCVDPNAGTACSGDEVCASGSCVALCPEEQVLCEGLCVDPETDRAHCGASADCQDANAGETCAEGTVCSAGLCVLTCQEGLIDCGGTCVDPLSNRSHCGASGDCLGANVGEACESDELCLAGACLPLCAPTELICAGACVDPQTDQTYCGASGDCAGANTGENCGLVSGSFCDAGACLTIQPVTNPDASSTQGEVTLTWTLSVTPGFGRTRVIRKQGSYPTSPQDGVIVADTGDGIAFTVDASPIPFETWYYTLFATNADASIFSVGVHVGADGTFVHGTRTCPPDTWLRGMDLDNNLICESPTIGLTFECTVPSSVSVSNGQTATVTCPAGYAVTGGGFSEIDQDGDGSGGDDFTSEPSGNAAWRVTFSDEVGTFRGYAVCCGIRTSITFPGPDCPAGQAIGGFDAQDRLTCADVLPVVQPLSCTTVEGPARDRNQTDSIATCPSGSYALGGGFNDIDQDGAGNGDDNFRTAPADDLSSWNTLFNDEAGTYTSKGRCCDAVQDVVVPASGLAGACVVGEMARGVTWEEPGRSLVCESPTITLDLTCSKKTLANTAAGVAVGQPLYTTCDAGTQVTGGGFGDIDQDGGGGSGDNFTSRPASDLTYWETSFGDEAGMWYGYAVCCGADNPVFSVGN